MQGSTVSPWLTCADINGKAATWRSLETALRGAATETALRRARLQAGAAQARFERTLARTLARTPAAPKVKVRRGCTQPKLLFEARHLSHDNFYGS